MCPRVFADVRSVLGNGLGDETRGQGDMNVQYIDALPTAVANRGMIKVALRASDLEGVDRIVGELAMSPNIASHLVVALTSAIADHNGAEACHIYAFAAPRRRSRRKSKPQG